MMPDQEFNRITRTEVISAVLVIAFGWGALWTGTQGARMAFNSNVNGGAAAVIRTTATGSPSPAASATPTAVVDSPSPTPFVTPMTMTETSSPAPSASPVVSVSPSPTIQSAPIVVPSPTPNTPLQSVTVMMAGDLMFDRGIRALSERNGYDSLLASVVPLFSRADIVAANLEGPITSNVSKTLLPDGHTTDSFTFTFPPASAQAVAHAGITLVNLANNHSYNFGLSGLAETKKYLQSAGVQWFGNPWNASTSEAVIDKNGLKIAFVGYHAFEPGFDRIVSQVKRLASAGDFVIVMPHWGIEYATSSNPLMRNQARALVAAGAGAIVGSHPHVILDHAWMGDVPVFYSVGNLLFDQYFSPQVMKGEIVELHIIKSTNSTYVDRVSVYETSMASHRNVTVGDQPTDQEP